MEKTDALNRFFDDRLTDPLVPVSGYSVTAVRDGRTVYRRQGGFRRFDWQNPQELAAMTADTRYRIASVSKMFTAVGILQLMDRGLLSLDEDAGKYLGFTLRNPAYPEARITVRMLLTHLSSLRNGDFYNFPCRYGLKELLLPEGCFWENGSRYAGPCADFDTAPGRRFEYADLNYVLLAAIIERLSGERFDLYERDHVLRPLGLRAQFNPALFDGEEIKLLAPTYRRLKDGKYDPSLPWLPQYDDYHNEPVPENIIYYNNPYKREPPKADDLTDYVIGTNPSAFNPAGGLRVSTEELAAFIRMMLREGITDSGERLLSPAAIREMSVPSWVAGRDGVTSGRERSRAYACGVMYLGTRFGGTPLTGDRRDAWLQGHSGSANGLYGGCWWNPEKNFGFAFAYTGTGNDPEVIPGRFSDTYLLQEQTLERLYCFLDT